MPRSQLVSAVSQCHYSFIAMDDATSAANRPASGSCDDHVLYGGSRRLKHRYEYGVNSKAALVECHPSFLSTPAEFTSLLEDVPGVAKVVWQTTKTSQKNIGRHYSEQNLLVYSSIGPGSASPPIEFELTRSQHLLSRRAMATVTIMFKDPPEGLLGEAWRILLAATKDQLLLPQHVQQYWRRHVAKWEGGEPVSDSTPATGPPPSKRGKRGATSPEPHVGEPSPPSPGNAGARPSSASQPAEAEAKGLGVTTHVGGQELQLSHAGKRARSNSSDESL